MSQEQWGGVPKIGQASAERERALQEHRGLQEKGIRNISELLRFIKSGVAYARAEQELAKLKASSEPSEASALGEEYEELKSNAEDALKALEGFEKEKLNIGESPEKE